MGYTAFIASRDRHHTYHMKTTALESFKTAAEVLCGRCAEISACAADPTQRPSRFFTGAELELTIEFCLEFICALASCRAKTLPTIRTVLQELERHVIDANSRLSTRMRNPEMVDFARTGETLLLRKIARGDETSVHGAKVIRHVRFAVAPLVRFYFNAIRRELVRSAPDLQAKRRPRERARECPPSGSAKSCRRGA